MKTYTRARFVTVSLLLVGVLAGMPAFSQDDPGEEEFEGRRGAFFLEFSLWIAQAQGLNYLPATQNDPTNPFGTRVLEFDHSTETESRWRLGYEIAKNAGKIMFTTYQHDEDVTLTGTQPANFIYGEILAHPAFAGYRNDGLVDSFAAGATTRLQDYRLDFSRRAFKSKRISGEWLVGIRKVDHDRLQGVAYTPLVPDLPGFISPTLQPLPDLAFLDSRYSGRGIEGGMEFTVPLWKDRVWLEAGVVIAVLRGKIDTSHGSTTSFYTLAGEVLLPEDYDTAFQDQPGSIVQEVTQIGLAQQSRDASSTVEDLNLGIRWRAWKDLEVFLGFRSTAYNDVGVDVRLAQVSSSVAGINLVDVTEVSRSATYEGWYAGISYSF